MWDDYKSYSEGMSWSDYKDDKKDEYTENVGGYYKTLKNKKILRYSDHSLHLAEDFRVFNKDAYISSHVNYPAANLWLDTNKKWW